jgi:predicted DNA binding CopG/RHH family protein
MCDEHGNVNLEEEIEVEVRKPVGIILSIRFSGEELQRVGKAARAQGLRTEEFIREAAVSAASEAGPGER